MISHQHQCVFVHIPKTAGMSIEMAFLKSLDLNYSGGQNSELLLTFNEDPEKGPKMLAHLTAEQYVSLGYIDEMTFDSYFTFAFVRDPWDRAVSLYKHYSFQRMMSFKSFLKRELPKLMKERHYFVMPQVNYVYDKQGTQQVDFIGRFESLQSDFQQIESKLAHPVFPLGYVNKSKAKGNIYSRWNIRFIWKNIKERPSRLFWFNPFVTLKGGPRSLYDETSKQLVYDIYREDIEKFNYTFEN